MSDSGNGRWYKYVCITTSEPDTKSNHNPKPTTKQWAYNKIYRVA